MKPKADSTNEVEQTSGVRDLFYEKVSMTTGDNGDSFVIRKKDFNKYASEIDDLITKGKLTELDKAFEVAGGFEHVIEDGKIVKYCASVKMQDYYKDRKATLSSHLNKGEDNE